MKLHHKDLLKIFCLFVVLIGFSPMTFAQTLKNNTVKSPDGKIVLEIGLDKSKIYYKVSKEGKSILDPSFLGFDLKDGSLKDNLSVKNISHSKFDETWKQPWGEEIEVRNHYNEMKVLVKDNSKLSREFIIDFKVYDDGFGFRYEFPKQKNLNEFVIMDELTEFNFPEDHKTWSIPYNTEFYEGLFKSNPISKLDTVATPLTMETKSGLFLTVHQANLTDYASMNLGKVANSTKLKSYLTPWATGEKVFAKAPFNTPWRTMIIANSAGDLVLSRLMLNLNEPNKLGDVSWIKPGRYIGIWWAIHMEKYTWKAGPKHGANTENVLRYIDFAAKHKFSGVLVEGWNKGWDGDWFNNGDVFLFDQAYDDFDLNAVTQYGESRGVTLIGHHETSGNVTNYRSQMQRALDLYANAGVEIIKTGYVADGGNIKRVDENGIVRHEWHDGQFMVNEYLYNVTEAAKRRISINTHEPVKDTGLRRTYPNWLAREGARGQEFNAWGSPPNPPNHMPTLAFTRMLSGPMDFTPGIFNFDFNDNNKEKAGIRPQTTLAKQLALYVVLYSPVQMAADLPRNYRANLPAFQFIKDVPADWEQSKALAGEVGDYVVFARQERGGNDWYLGALTDEDPRKVEIALDFLEPGKKYQAQIYRDGEEAHWHTKPYDLVIEQKNVSAKDKMTLMLAASGGSAIRFKQLD